MFVPSRVRESCGFASVLLVLAVVVIVLIAALLQAFASKDAAKSKVKHHLQSLCKKLLLIKLAMANARAYGYKA